ncbi:MAG: 4Fe-4S dicluster domain-containing protein [Candidatus Sericytochromatia bacterium]|nr:4Fe-4S dicluster domain-containing protein [Candidatus Sericytochromatia bacterium]
MATIVTASRATALAAAARDLGLLDAQGHPLWARLAAPWKRVLVVPASADPACPTDALLWHHQAAELYRALDLLADCVGGARDRLEIAWPAGVAALLEPADLRRAIPGANLLTLPDRYPAAATEHVWLARMGHAFPGAVEAAEAGVLLLDTIALWQLGWHAYDRLPTPRLLVRTDATGHGRAWLAPLGSPLGPLLELNSGETAWAGGALAGRRLQTTDVLTPDVHWVQLLPAGHPAHRHRDLPVDVALRRALSSCGTCTACTDWCPSADVPASGGAIAPPDAATGLVPHRLVRMAAYGQEGPAEILLGARHCGACGICSVTACPADVHPASILVALREGLVAGGVARSASPTESSSRLVGPMEGPSAHHFRLSEDALLTRLGTARPQLPPTPVAHLPSRVRLPLILEGGLPLSPLWPEGGHVKAGQPVAAAPQDRGGVRLLAPIAGRLSWSPGHLEVHA